MRLKSPISSAFPLNSSSAEDFPLITTASHKRNELWMAIHFPRLAMEIIEKENHSSPFVVIEKRHKSQFVHLANTSAEQSGVVSGMLLNTAYTLCADLKIRDIDLLAQQEQLQKLAEWAFKFTSRVNLQPPSSLLLELAGSIQYYGSLESLEKKIKTELKRKWLYNFFLAISPSPEASLLLAISGKQEIIKETESLRSVLGTLPASCLMLNEKHKHQLKKAGVRRLRDIWRLPPATLRRRFGHEPADYMDRLLAKKTSLISTHKAARHFNKAIDISYPTNDCNLILIHAFLLLQDFCVFLRKTDLYSNSFSFYFKSENKNFSVITIYLRRPLRDSRHFIMLLETKLSQLKLNAPIFAIRLVANSLHAYTTQTNELFPGGNNVKADKKNISTLLEQLQSRLGPRAVNAVFYKEDHRPEYAISKKMEQSENIKKNTELQPFWLLPEPKQLLKKNNHLYYKTIIRLREGPQRIESGWWDGFDIKRDYYIAIDEIAGCLWIFNDLKERKKWYLHGLFG